jgi:hypothetical protein
MELERSLLEFGEACSSELDAVRLYILQRSDSAAITAVVASVATAFPHASGETLLVLLRSPLCILLDRNRLANEPQMPSRMLAMMPRVNADDEVYEQEREEADARAHRHRDLETPIISMQFGPLVSRVHEILDRHRAETPPVGEQDENDCAWRLAIHRMDLRQYAVVEVGTEADAVPGILISPEDGRQYVRLELRTRDPDVKDMVDQSAAQFQVVSARLGLLTWGLKVFGHEEDATYDPAQWREKLQEARAARASDDGGEDYDPGRDSLGFVASVCVRDHWKEMTEGERSWCVNMVCLEVRRNSDNWNQPACLQHGGLEADRACACVLPLLLGQPLDEISRSQVRQLLVVALTHATHEVRWYAASGVGSYLWQTDRELVLSCVDALAAGATLVEQAADAETSRSYHERRPIDDIEAEVASAIRRRFFEPDSIPGGAHRAFDPAGWLGQRRTY